MRWISQLAGKYREAILMALDAITANKLRSALTVLGVLIGVTTVIAMMSVIDGLNKSFEADVGALGAHNFYVQKYNAVQLGFDFFREERDDFSIEDAYAIQEECSAVAVADLSSWRFVNAEYGGKKARFIGLTTTSTEFYDVLNDQYVEEGRLINRSDVLHARDVAVIGKEVVAVVFPGIDPIGRRLRVDGRQFQVIGVFEEKGEVFGDSWDDYIVIPETTYTNIYGKDKEQSWLTIRARDTASMPLAVDQVETLMRRRRGVKPAEDNDFEITTPDQLMQIWQQITGGAFAAMIAIAGVSLLVGGIGIMNIMLVAVTERTREIGVRKALGARRRDIMSQFIIEAIVVSLVGGIAGIILGVLLGNLVGWLSPLEPATSVPSLFIGFIFSVGVGLFFGIYPAWKASKLDPIEALRFE
ncbi:MAG: FtsX-like permease family protein [bacterium]|nr:FtsX-like permease family protein [bacterium]